MDERKRPAWREPMVWLVVAVPLAAVIGGLWMVAVAVRSGGEDATTDDVRRTGQVQVADLGPDERASALRLRAVLQVLDGDVSVFPVAGDWARTEPLSLTLVHPQRQAADRTLVLVADERGWRAGADVDAAHDWIVHLRDARGTWRIRGRLPAGQQAVHLAPSLDGRGGDAAPTGAPAPGPR